MKPFPLVGIMSSAPEEKRPVDLEFPLLRRILAEWG